MSLQPNEIVWVFDGRAGMQRILADLVGGLLVSMQQLMPPSALQRFDDPLSAIEADATFDARSALSGNRLERLFPEHVSEEFDEEGDAREGVIRSRATDLHGAASTVIADLEEAGELVPVREASVHAWLRTLGALRASWHADLVGSEAPDLEATPEQLDENPALGTLLEWLAYLIEDLLATRSACISAGTGIDISEL